MKLNNKGFAITAVLYGLLILFSLLVSSYLVVLSAKKNKLDIITSEIEEDYHNTCKKVVIDSASFPFTVSCSGEYTFNITGSSDDRYDCRVELTKGDIVSSISSKLYSNEVIISFKEEECTNIGDIKDVNSIKYCC